MLWSRAHCFWVRLTTVWCCDYPRPRSVWFNLSRSMIHMCSRYCALFVVQHPGVVASSHSPLDHFGGGLRKRVRPLVFLLASLRTAGVRVVRRVFGCSIVTSLR